MRIVLCIVITFLPTFAGAALPIEYNAESGVAIESPTIQGWLESGIDGQVTVGAVEDAGMRAWRIEDNTNSNSPRYAISLATEDFQEMYQDGWEFSFVVRGVAGDPSSNICGFCGWGLTVDRDPGWGLTGRERVGFSIARIDKDDSFEVLPIHGGVINLGPGSADVFHTIHCIGRADSPLYEFYLDGEFEGLFDIRDGGSNSSFDNQIRFTSGSTAGTGRITYWNLVKLTVPAITILQTDGTTAVAEGSPGEDTYIIYLNQEPGSPVSLFVDPNGAGDGSGMEIDLGAGPGTGITLLWTPVNWSERKTVTVRAVDDGREEGPHEAVIRHVVDSEDVYYDGFQAVDVIVEISDDEPYCGDDNTFYLNADIDRDCFVNLYDMAILALDWLTCSDPANEACKQYLPPEPPKKIIVFDSRYDTRYPVYRQPSIIVTEAGTVLAFCQGREGRSDSAENDVVLKRSFDGGRTWGPLQLLHDAGDDNLNNVQSIQVRETGRIFVMYGRFPQGCHTSCVEPGYYSPEHDRHHRTYMMYSDDDGETWSEPHDITQTVREPTDQYYSAPGNGFGIQLRRGLHAGRVIMPFQSRWVSKPRNDRSFFSDDYGLTWQVGGYPSTDFITAIPDELQMVELIDGSVLMNARSSSGHRRLTAVSGDGGETWGQITADEQLIEPPAMGTIIRYSDPLDGEVSRILFANPASTSGRHTGTVRLSYDECQTWTVSKVVETGYYGYSCLTVLPDGGIGVLYESDGNFHTMTLAVLSLRWLTDGED